MDKDNELAESKSRTYQLIGRNVLLFQQMEHLLKIILPRSTVSISPDTDISALKDQRYAEVEKCSLGTLVNRFIDEVCDPNELPTTDHSDRVGARTTFRLNFETPEGGEALFQRLKALVKGRNDLVHHFLLQIDAKTVESWCATHEALEEQYRLTLAEIKVLQQLVESLDMTHAFFASPEGQRELVYGPIRERLIEKLRTEAGRSSDPDGWTSIRAAIRSDGEVASDHITKLLDTYEIPTVSAFLLAVSGFEICHEKDSKGKIRTYYRVKSNEIQNTLDSSKQDS